MITVENEVLRLIAVAVLMISFVAVMFYASSREYKEKK